MSDRLATLGLSAFEDGQQVTGFGRPFGLGIDGEGLLYVTDMDLHAIFRIAPALDRWSMLDGPSAGWTADRPFLPDPLDRAPARPASGFDGPHAVDFDADGRAYVTTYYTPAIHVLDHRGDRVGSIGGTGAPLPLAGPATAFFDERERLLVAEYRHHAVLAFDRDGRYLGGLGLADDGAAMRFGDGCHRFRAGSSPGAFDRPHMCRMHPDGHMVVADTWNHRLQRFDADGGWAGWIGLGSGGPEDGWSMSREPARPGSGPGALNAPVAVAFDAAAELMAVTDWGNGRIALCDLEGRHRRSLCAGALAKPYDARFWQGKLAVADSHHGRVLLLPAAGDLGT